ncbi:MAG: hypothetical protein IPI03_14530 [Rubrivivax sp.]|nr:hypothetical protein [Rubrivivax sp.]MBK8529186.1 hypothetical protein [Rubrivivax sp.]
MSTGQKATIALAFEKIEAEAAKKRKLAPLKKGVVIPVSANLRQRSAEQESGKASDKAAKAVGASPRNVQTAEKIGEQAATTRQNADSGPNDAALVPAYLIGASAPCGAATQTDRWRLTVQGLQGIPWPAPAAMPGRRFECRDAPIEPAELADVTNATELGLLLGVSRQRAHQLIQQRAAKAHTATEGTEP